MQAHGAAARPYRFVGFRRYRVEGQGFVDYSGADYEHAPEIRDDRVPRMQLVPPGQ